MGSAKHCSHTFETVDKGICFRHRIIKCKRSSGTPRYSETLHERLGTMVTGSHGYTELVEQHPDIVVMLVVDVKRYYRAFVGSRPVDIDSGYFFDEPVGCVLEKHSLVSRNVVISDFLDEVNGSGNGGYVDEVGSTRLELLG